MNLLDQINSSEDIKRLTPDQLPPLCEEIRQFLIESVAKTGGHFASNLGVVELSVAIHRVYDSKKDKIIFDVGHQSYTHKIITGRKNQFDTLRQHGGLSGFPRSYESPEDAFIGGHSSNSISAAVGMARARTLCKEDHEVIAVIGDGAMTGGLAMEGLANAASSGEPIVIVLNDNNMSISGNVGGLHSALQHLRMRPSYLNFKKRFRQSVHNRAFYEFSHNVKEGIKAGLLDENMFTEMGLAYSGPVDGHNVQELETALRWAKEQQRPTVLHVLTVKGKGYPFAEQYPSVYHGVGSFDLALGVPLTSAPNFSSIMGDELCKMAETDEKIVAITAAMTDGTGLSDFAERFPDRFFDIGIAEGHAVTMAAGMAKGGITPVFAVYSSFLQRAYDMLVHDVSLQDLHTVFCVDRAGLVGNDGETHHGVFDVAYLSSVPNMSIYCPASFEELRAMLRAAVYEEKGPVAVRYPRGGEGTYTECHTEEETVLKEGTDITLVCYGTVINEVLKAAALPEASGISFEIIKLGKIKKNSFAKTLNSLKHTKKLIVVEEVCSSGCIGSVITSKACSAGIRMDQVKLMNLHNGIVLQGKVPELYEDCGIDAASICRQAIELMKNEESKT